MSAGFTLAPQMDRDPVLAEVIALERALLDPATRADRAALMRLLHPDFREVGVSGRTWDRDAMVEELVARPATAASPEDVAALRIAPDVVLVTYATPGSLRSSLWRRGPAGWRVVFHQGTPVDR